MRLLSHSLWAGSGGKPHNMFLNLPSSVPFTISLDLRKLEIEKNSSVTVPRIAEHRKRLLGEDLKKD